MKSLKSINVVFLIVLAIIFFSCKNEVPLYEDSRNLADNEFTFIPGTPKENSEVSMIFYGCSYYQTSSVKIENQKIFVKKRFNGAMKRPCIFAQDTIALGKLNAGNYLVTLEIVDISSFASDSIFSRSTQTLNVTKN